jgi:cytochrome c oxidase assembly protein subunit 11
MTTAVLDNRKMLIKLTAIAIGMFGFGFALVPFYEKICEVSGINNLLQADKVTNTQVDLARSVIIEFDANTHDMPWRFRPLESNVTVHPGQLTTITYEVVNTRDRPVSGQAIPSYGPRQAAQYFRKMECFCFSKQTLAPGEKRQMPVTFVVDPALPKDVGTITLSYTFFEVEGSIDATARLPVSQGGKS